MFPNIFFCLASGGTILLQVVIRESNSCLRSVYLIDVKTWAFREERHINQIQLLADVSTTELITYNLLLYVCTKTWGIFMPSHRLSDDRLIRQAVHTEDLYAKPSSGPGGSRTRVQKQYSIAFFTLFAVLLGYFISSFHLLATICSLLDIFRLYWFQSVVPPLCSFKDTYTENFTFIDSVLFNKIKHWPQNNTTRRNNLKFQKQTRLGCTCNLTSTSEKICNYVCV